MTKKEFIEYMKTLDVYKMFFIKVSNWQNEKNKKRKNPRSGSRIEKEVNNMWAEMIGRLYENLSHNSQGKSLIALMEEHDILTSIREGIEDMNFEE